jgi:hypothetical protein
MTCAAGAVIEVALRKQRAGVVERNIHHCRYI